QLHLYAGEDEEAIALLEEAIKNTGDRQHKIRWTYLTAQLLQLTGRPEAAYVSYTKVIKSNAPFDMAFNANLSRISIQNELEGNTSDRTRQLTALLKDDKNRDFIDQIFYQIGNSYADQNDLTNAIISYNHALRNSTTNLTQRALAYYQLAEIYFSQRDFIRSKAYYDSTLNVLPETYPDFELISRKAENIELLADRLTTIAREDTLQMLAALPEAERTLRVDAMAEEEYLRTRISSLSESTFGTLPGTSAGEGKFYFNNSVALSQGMTDFKNRWGNRRLEDNWRRSQKSAADLPA